MSKDGEPVEEEAHGPSYIAISKIGSMLKVVHFNGRYGSFTHYKVSPNAWGDDWFFLDWVKYKDPLVKFQVARSSIDKLIETSQEACGRARGHVWLRSAASEHQYWQQKQGFAGAGLVDVKQEGVRIQHDGPPCCLRSGTPQASCAAL